MEAFRHNESPEPIVSAPISGVIAVSGAITGVVSVSNLPAVQTVQNMQDASRVIFSAATTIAGVVAVTSEAMLTMTPVRGGVAGTPATSFAVTSGKKMRISLMNAGLTNTAAAAVATRVVVRYSDTGAVTITSPILTMCDLHSGGGATQQGDHEDITIPDGVELSGTMQIGISQVSSATTATIRASIVGFEY